MTSDSARVREGTRIAAGLIACAVLACAAAAGETGRCYSADVPHTMVLPDATVHGPGNLRVCVERRINPVTVAHRVSLDGHPVGMYLSRTGVGEGRPGTADGMFVFVRNESDQFVLEGYSRPLGDHVRTYRMHQ